MTDQTVESYGEQLFGTEDELLRTMRAEAVEQGLPSIQVPTELGRLLAVMIRAGRCKTALEVGTLFGYSAVLIARALPENGTLTTLEVNSVHAEAARNNLQRAGVASKVSLLEGAAIDTLKTLEGKTFDFVFIDADKPGYPAYLEWALKLTRSGSVIVADNVWRGGSVLQEDDETSRAMASFNQSVASNSRLLSTIIPTRNGEDAASVSVVRSDR